MNQYRSLVRSHNLINETAFRTVWVFCAFLLVPITDKEHKKLICILIKNLSRKDLSVSRLQSKKESLSPYSLKRKFSYNIIVCYSLTMHN